MSELPTKLIDYHCSLEAIDEGRNVARAYHIHSSRDLFDHIVVALRWGRISGRGAGLTVSFACEDAAQRFIDRTLARRATAPRRIGVAYQSVANSSPSNGHGTPQLVV